MCRRRRGSWWARYNAPVKHLAHFHELLKYVKPIDLFGPYSRDFRLAQAAGKLPEFHQEVREFFYALTMEATDFHLIYNKFLREDRLRLTTRRRFLYSGVCHGSAKAPLGVRPAIRRTEEYQNLIRAKVQQAREDEAAAEAGVAEVTAT